MPESTVRGIIKSYNKNKVETSEGGPSLPKKSRGAKTLLPKDIDDKVIAMIKSMREAATGVTYDMTISIARGIVCANDRTLLKDNGGNIDLSISWAQSIHKRLGFTRRKHTTCKQPVSPGLLKEIGFTFYRAINDIVAAYDITSELIIDQTPLPFFLISGYTLTRKGDKSVPISNCSDYRQITGTFGISMSGDFLPIQLIYQGKISRCHPRYKFPDEFHVTQTENHWSNEEKCLEMVAKILIPYVKRTTQELQLRKNQEWLLISDVFKGHWAESVKESVRRSNGKMVPVPSNMTNEFQPLDLTVNQSCKAYLRKQTNTWFSD